MTILGKFRRELQQRWDLVFPPGMSGGGGPELRLQEVLQVWYGRPSLAALNDTDAYGHRGLDWLLSLSEADWADEINAA